jgi:hypothetical protein
LAGFQVIAEGMIGRNQEFSPNLESLVLTELEIPEQRGIHVDQAGSAEDIAPLIAELIDSRLSERARIEPFLNASLVEPKVRIAQDIGTLGP